MDFITVTKDNIDKEHICCAVSSDSDCQTVSKKQWLRERFDDGLVFLKADIREKCFIEYIPAEKAWAPVNAPGYMYIDCLWVSGGLKGHGYSSELLDRCINDSKAKGKKGLCILSAKKKMPFLSDPGFLRHKGFEICDSAAPYYDLYCLSFDKTEPLPTFSPSVGTPPRNTAGFTLYYTNQCPYTVKYVPVFAEAAEKHGVPFTAVHITSAEEARSSPAPFTAYSLFYNGVFVTNEIQSAAKAEKLITDKSK